MGQLLHHGKRLCLVNLAVAEIAQFVYLVQVVRLFQEVFGEIDNPELFVSLGVFENHADLELAMIVSGVDKAGDDE